VLIRMHTRRQVQHVAFSSTMDNLLQHMLEAYPKEKVESAYDHALKTCYEIGVKRVLGEHYHSAGSTAVPESNAQQ
jgi:hypothetical protein